MLTLLCLNAVGAVGFYLCFLFVTTYLRQTEHLAASRALDINTVAMVVQLLSILGAAALADRIGRKPVLVAAAAGQLLLGWPAFWLMHHTSPGLALLGQCMLAIMTGAFTASVSTVMAEMLPRRVRCTAMSFSLNVGFGVLGGLTPLVALYLIRREADDLSPAYLLMGAAAISLLTLFRIPETGGMALQTDQDLPEAGA